MLAEAVERPRFEAEAKFCKKCGAALTLNCLMCGKSATDLVNSAARARLVFVKCAANVRQIFFNKVGFL